MGPEPGLVEWRRHAERVCCLKGEGAWPTLYVRMAYTGRLQDKGMHAIHTNVALELMWMQVSTM